jgi:hypothetical protein
MKFTQSQVDAIQHGDSNLQLYVVMLFASPEWRRPRRHRRPQAAQPATQSIIDPVRTLSSYGNHIRTS